MGARQSKSSRTSSPSRMKQAGGGKTLKANNSAKKRTLRATGRRGLKDQLLDLYHGLSGFQASVVGFGDYRTTYGEVTEAGIANLSENFQRHAPLAVLPADRRHFYDLGCGIGRAVVGLAILNPELKSHGIEIVPERVRFARQALARIKHKQVAARVSVDQASFLDPKISYKNATWIFISNMCFDEVTQHKVAERLEKELERGAVIICSKELPLGPQTRLERVASGIIVPMTWSANSVCNVYRVRV